MGMEMELYVALVGMRKGKGKEGERI